MPRGVYDRSKTKAQRTAEKPAAKTETVTKRKYTKRATAAVAAAPAAPSYSGDFEKDTTLFSLFTSSLPAFQANSAMYNKLTAKIDTIVERLMPEAPAIEVVAEKVVEKKAEAALPFVPPVATSPAAAPFNPIPFNGSNPSGN